jgi:hypothetical protein
MEIAANGVYPFVPITALHAIVDGYGLPSSSFHAPNSISPNLPTRSIDVQSDATAQHRSTPVSYWHIAEFATTPA